MERLWLPLLADQLNLPQLADARLSGTPWALFATGILAGFALFALRRDEVDIDRKLLCTTFLGSAFGLFAAHWTALCFQPQRLVEEPITLIILGTVGFSSLGLYPGALAGMAIATRIMRIPLAPYTDALAPPTLLAAGVARLGCLLQGCDFGTLAPHLPWALRYPRGTAAFSWLRDQGLLGSYHRVGLPQHPFPLYEAIPVLLCGVILTLYPNAFGHRPGQRASASAALYCAIRLFAETTRANTPTLLGYVTVMQACCLVGLLGSLSVWLTQRQAHTLSPPTQRPL